VVVLIEAIPRQRLEKFGWNRTCNTSQASLTPHASSDGVVQAESGPGFECEVRMPERDR